MPFMFLILPTPTPALTARRTNWGFPDLAGGVMTLTGSGTAHQEATLCTPSPNPSPSPRPTASLISNRSYSETPLEAQAWPTLHVPCILSNP